MKTPRTHLEYVALDERNQPIGTRIMYHPDLGWGIYQRYDNDWEREEDLTWKEVSEEITYFNYRVEAA